MELPFYLSGAADNSKLVDQLVHKGIIKTDKVANVMKAVDRIDFCGDCANIAYFDCPQSIGYGATISAPHMHAYALEYLKNHFKEGGKVLDVGCGSGYLCAAFLKMMNGTGKVVGIEHIDELVQLSKGMEFNTQFSFKMILNLNL